MIVYFSMMFLTVFFGIIYEYNNRFVLRTSVGGTDTLMRSKKVYFSLVVILLVFIFVSGLQSGYGDTANYRVQFEQNNYSLPEDIGLMWQENKAPLFQIYMAVIKLFTNDSQWFLLVTAIITNFFMWQTLCKTSCFVPLSCFFYICSGLFMWSMNGIRQYLVACILFACHKWILDGKFIKWFLLLFVLYFCHTSVVFIVPIYFLFRSKPWSKMSVLFFSIILILGVFYTQLLDVFFDFAEGTPFDEYSNQVDYVASTSIIRTAFMSIPAVLSFVLRKEIAKENSPIINMSVNAAIISCGLYVLASIGAGNLIGRVAVYSDLYVYIILMPYLMKLIIYRYRQKLVALGYMGAASVFYLYQMMGMQRAFWYSHWVGWYFH